jgi:hypothetical protein
MVHLIRHRISGCERAIQITALLRLVKLTMAMLLNLLLLAGLSILAMMVFAKAGTWL